jgi:tetratricopeptide (TPR) repeat protein
MQLIRRDVGYTIISRFEEAFRHFLTSKIPILLPNFETNLPSGMIQKAKDRTGIQSWESVEDFLENSDFPDLKEIITFNGMYKSYFPDSELQQTNFEKIMVELYELRCKIAHVKQYFTSLDLDVLSENSKVIAHELGEHGHEFLEFAHQISENPEKVVIPTPIEFLSDVDLAISNISHNVPTPDYEFEGGFVGRDDDIKKINGFLDGNLHRVITISGAGGVGKTALALRIVQKYLRSKKNPFDGIVWLSAKETKLSYLGIEDIEPTLRNYEELLDTILDVMGYGIVNAPVEQKEADVATLFEIHNSILIVIDNLETITDERIINFILDAHPKAKILITSRKGLGQVERRHELKQLKEKEAVILFRLISRDKRLQSLIALDDETIKFYIKKIACYPLAIKWVIGQVAVGKDINGVIDSINETTSDISRFCFDQIYKALSDSSKKILCALSMFDDSPSLGVLNYVLNISGQILEDSLRELILVSLVIPEQYKTEQDEISTKYVLLSLTRGYVRQQLDQDSLLKRELSERLQTVQTTLEEAERAKRQYRFSLANLGATSEEEKIAAMIATTAFQKYQGGRYIDAVEDYKSAIRIAPRFASVYRN